MRVTGILWKLNGICNQFLKCKIFERQNVDRGVFFLLFRQLSVVKEEPMSSPKRHFINPYSDYKGEPVKISTDLWRSYILEAALKCYDKQPANSRNIDGGLYVGVSGVAYMLFSLSQSELFSDERQALLKKAHEVIKFCDDQAKKARVRRKTDESGFLLGHAGTYAVAAAIYETIGDKKSAAECVSKYVAAGDICTPPDFVDFGGDEFLVGRAGYLAGALWLNKFFNKDVVPLGKINTICNSILEYGRWYSKSHNSPCPLMFSYHGTEYLGAAHGLSSILQMLLSCPSFLDAKPDCVKDIKSSVDYMLSIQTGNGNFPCAMDELGHNSRPEANELIHWCHGAPGVVYLMAKAYLLWNDSRYLDSCIKAAEVTWQKGLLKKGPGICHGVGGNGYVFLLLYRLTNDEKYLYRANKFAEFLLTDDFKKARVPDAPYSLYEGWAGTVCFLDHLLHPKNAQFPFMDVF